MDILETWIGADLPTFVGLTVILFGAAAFMTGQAVAQNWRPAWQCVVYCGLLGLFDRFLHYALFDGVLLSLSGYITHWLLLSAIGLSAFRMQSVKMHVTQYPWLYERSGLFRWRERQGRS